MNMRRLIAAAVFLASISSAGAVDLTGPPTTLNGTLTGTYTLGGTSTLGANLTLLNGVSLKTPDANTLLSLPKGSTASGNLYSNVTLGNGAGGVAVPSTGLDYLTAIGFNAAQAITTADHVTCVGAFACAGLTTGTSLYVDSFGIDSLRAATGVSTVTAIGSQSMMNSVGGTQSVGLGFQALMNNDGGGNTGVGYHAGTGIAGTHLTGGNNTALGTNALNLIQGAAQFNTAVGATSLPSLTTGQQNTGLGYLSGNNLQTGTRNVLLGYAAGFGVTGGSNICIGYNSCVTNATTGSGLIVVGTSQDAASSGQSNYMNLGGVVKTSGTDVPQTSASTIAGTLTVGTAGTAGTGQLSLAGITSGSTAILPAAAASGTWTLPATTDTFVGKGTTDTLTLKTLTAAVENNPVITGPAPVACTGTCTLGAANKGTYTRLDTASGSVATLPGATGTGTVYRIYTSVATTSAAHKVLTNPTTDTIIGTAIGENAGTAKVFVGNAGTFHSIQMPFAGTQPSGGFIGDTIVCTDVANTIWKCDINYQAGTTPTTPYSASTT